VIAGSGHLFQSYAYMHSLLCRSFIVAANATTLGTKTATVSLTKADSNPSNNWDDAVVSPFVNCGQPFGLLAPRPSCPAGRVYVGPDNAFLPSSTDLGNACCIDQAPVGVLAYTQQQHCCQRCSNRGSELHNQPAVTEDQSCIISLLQLE